MTDEEKLAQAQSKVAACREHTELCSQRLLEAHRALAEAEAALDLVKLEVEDKAPLTWKQFNLLSKALEEGGTATGEARARPRVAAQTPRSTRQRCNCVAGGW